MHDIQPSCNISQKIDKCNLKFTNLLVDTLSRHDLAFLATNWGRRSCRIHFKVHRISAGLMLSAINDDSTVEHNVYVIYRLRIWKIQTICYVNTLYDCLLQHLNWLNAMKTATVCWEKKRKMRRWNKALFITSPHLRKAECIITH